MSHNITNCIQKIWTELSFDTNIRIRLRYICYLDIFRLLYIITELIQTQKDPT